jgi:GAF domain-containing protein
MSADQLLAEIARLAGATAQAVEPAGFDEHLRAITDAAKDIFSAEACSLALVDDEGENLVYRVASGVGAESIVGQKIPVGHGIAGWVVSSGMPMSIDDVANDPRFQRSVAESTGYIPRSLLVMPLETERAILGVITVLDREPPADAAGAQRETTLLGLFARQASLAIENARTFRSVGQYVLTILAHAAEDSDVRQAIERAWEASPISDTRLVEVAALLARLGRSDPDLAAAVASAMESVVEYAEGRVVL